MSRKRGASKASEEILSFDCEEDDEIGFSENLERAGKVISSFSFANTPLEVKAELTEKPELPENLTDNGRLQKQPYGTNPPVDGEHFEIRRTFVFRRSTVRMLNKLKAEHVYENIYLKIIVEKAVSFYYDFVLPNKAPTSPTTLFMLMASI